jgi:hypothetical protein
VFGLGVLVVCPALATATPGTSYRVPSTAAAAAGRPELDVDRPARPGHPARQVKRRNEVLLLGMIALGLAAFGAMWAFIHLCERV